MSQTPEHSISSASLHIPLLSNLNKISNRLLTSCNVFHLGSLNLQLCSWIDSIHSVEPPWAPLECHSSFSFMQSKSWPISSWFLWRMNWKHSKLENYCGPSRVNFRDELIGSITFETPTWNFRWGGRSWIILQRNKPSGPWCVAFWLEVWRNWTCMQSWNNVQFDPHFLISYPTYLYFALRTPGPFRDCRDSNEYVSSFC